jgi:hypothetical protein
MLFVHVPISNLRAEHDKSLSMPVYQPADHGYFEMVHVALKLRSDIMAQPGYDIFNIGEEEAISSVPDKQFMLPHLLIGAQSLLDENEEYDMTQNE